MSRNTVVKGIIYNRQGRFLLQHRDNKSGILEPNCWSLFGGGVEEGETLIEALERELQEELSCRVGTIEEELFRWHQRSDNTLHVCFRVRFEAINTDLVLTEGQGLGWFTLDEISDLSLGSLVRDNLSQFFQFPATKS